jgi:hypothetical protein
MEHHSLIFGIANKNVTNHAMVKVPVHCSQHPGSDGPSNFNKMVAKNIAYLTREESFQISMMLIRLHAMILEHALFLLLPLL